MPTDRQFWGPRTEQSAITLTAAFQFIAVDIMQLVVAAANIEIKQDLLSLAFQYTKGAGDTDNSRLVIVISWSHNIAGPFYAPPDNRQIEFIAGSAASINRVLGVKSPGGFRFFNFGVMEIISGEASFGTLTTESSGEYIL